MFLNFFNSFNLTLNVGYRKSTRQISQQFIKNYFIFYFKKRIIWEALPEHCMKRRCLAEGQRWGSLRQAPPGYSGLKTYRNNTLRECSGPLCLTSLILYSQPQITYVYRVQRSVRRLPNYWPPLPLTTHQVCPPPTKGWGEHTLRAVRRWGGGSKIFWKTPDIGLAS